MKNITKQSGQVWIIALIAIALSILVIFFLLKNGVIPKINVPVTPKTVNDFGPVGSLNHEYLQDNKFKKLIIEIDLANGLDSDQRAQKGFVDTIKDFADKPDGIVMSDSNSFKAGKSSYTRADIETLAKENRTNRSKGDTITMHIMYLDGSFSEDKDALGLAWAATEFVIFEEKINDSITGRIFASDIEKALLIHEFGHLLGLVNINYASSIDHEDKDHPNHSNNEDSVMYWAVESVNVRNLKLGPSYKFDNSDKSDINKIKSGEY